MTVTGFVLDEKIVFQALNQSSAMIQFDPQGNVLWANDNFAKAMGYQPGEVAGLHHRKFCLPEYANSQAYADFWNNLRKGVAFHDKIQRVTKDGRFLWLEAYYTPVLDESGRVQAVVKLASDITEMQTVLYKSTDEFMSLVEEMTASTNEVHHSTLSIVSEMDVLNKESEVVKQNIQKIEKVVSFVRDIATQSNLLGLNASIEAARAGEHGRGFSIVANEIRKMADTSKSSANDITLQLGEMIESIGIMVENINNITEKIDGNSKAIEELKEAYKNIAATAEELSNII